VNPPADPALGAPPILRRGDLAVRRATQEDAPQLSAWLSDERVLEFYDGRDRAHDLEMASRKIGDRQGDPVTGCIVERGGEPIGWIQFYPLEPPMKSELQYPVAETIYGHDQFIGDPDLWDRGIGTELVSAMFDHLTAALGADRVVVGPQAGNPRAVRCHEKAGYNKVRLLPRNELHEGAMVDCWLMERPAPDLA
jgi:aminoglycoside 6'-N-acetyltransferase